MEAARGRPRATFFGSRRLAGAAPATVRAADPGHAGRTPPAKSEAGGFMDDGGILRLRVQGRSSLRLRVYGQRRHAQSKSRGSQCDRELTHRSPPSVKRPKVGVKHDAREDNPAFAELPSLFTYQALENSKIVVAALASISSTHKTAAPRFAFAIRWPVKPAGVQRRAYPRNS